MSAIRNKDRDSRRLRNTPYSANNRKKSAWSFSGLLSFFNPLKSRSESLPQQPEADYLESTQTNVQGVDDLEGKTPAERLQSRGQQISNTLNGHGNNASASSSAHTLDHQASPARAMTMTALDLLSPPRSESSQEDSPSRSKNLDTVVSFLQGKRDQPINAIEIEGLVSLINKSNAEDDREPFRFSSSSPTPPVRGTTPGFSFGVGQSFSMPIVGESPRKVLTKNPNGVYKWQGGGSAKPKNRYRSPAFGASQSMPAGLKLTAPPVSPSDTKRRRVGEDAHQSTSIASHVQTPARSAAPSPAQIPPSAAVPFPATPGSPSPSMNGSTSPSKAGANGRSPLAARPSLPPKLTAPAHPSPLRQAWGAQSDTSSSPSSSPGPSKPTNAATFMTELIKDVTPRKKPDLSNPYQTASPVKPRAPVPRKVSKRTRATGKPTPPTEMAQDDATPLAIIEATIPKGSKRQRPPANLERSTNGSSSFSARDDDMDVDELEHERSPSPPKKPKKAMVNGNVAPSVSRTPSSDSIVVEEMDDGDASPTPPTPVLKPAEIIEPKSNTFSRQPAVVVPPAPANGSAFFSAPSTSKTPAAPKSSLPKEPSKLRFSYQPDVSMSSEEPAPELSSAKPLFSSLSAVQDPKQRALSVNADALPVFTFGAATPSSSASSGKQRAQSTPSASLPTFEFKPQPVASTSKLPPPTSTGFNWAAAGAAAPKTDSSSWTCSMCSLKNPASQTEKCSVCEEPKPGAAKSSSSSTSSGGGFDWAASGFAPTKPSGSSWNCSTCGLSNDASHTEKCFVCEAPKPDAKPAESSSGGGGGFNWAAAGMSAPVKSASTWKCKECLLDNPASATEKCVVCEAAR